MDKVQTVSEKHTKPSEAVVYNKQVVNTHSGHLKSHEYDEAMLLQMAKRLNAISMGMGFKDAIRPEILLNLSRWIKEQFGGVSMQEVSIAFDMVTAKKIGRDIRHYNTFSQQYVGEVLNAFTEYRAKQILLYKESEAQKLPEPKGATEKEMYEVMKRMAVEKGEVMKVGNWTDAYNYAWKQNLIHRMSDTERELFKSQIEEAMEMEERAGFTEAFTGDIQSECHKRILQAHFQQMIDGN